MKNKPATAEVLFELACAGDIEALAVLYQKGVSMDVRYSRFGEEHSLIMGTFRNRQWDTVRWLLAHGARLTRPEQEAVNDRYQETRLIAEMQKVFVDRDF